MFASLVINNTYLHNACIHLILNTVLHNENAVAKYARVTVDLWSFTTKLLQRCFIKKSQAINYIYNKLWISITFNHRLRKANKLEVVFAKIPSLVFVIFFLSLHCNCNQKKLWKYYYAQFYSNFIHRMESIEV